jgi:hypothetical protein
MKRVALLSAGMLLLFAFTGAACQKKEQPSVAPPGQGMPGQAMPGEPGPPHGMMGGPPKVVVVPDNVKDAWKAVKIQVEYRDKNTKKQYTVPLNSDFEVPDSDVTLRVGSFLPHFTMTADTITSGSNKLENPATNVEVLRDGQPVFRGWLFAKHPDVHPFEDDKLALTLVEGVRK